MSRCRRRVSCADVGLYFPGAPSCCSSCHDDYDEEYDEPFEIELSSDVVAYVCCGKTDWVKEHAAEILSAMFT